MDFLPPTAGKIDAQGKLIHLHKDTGGHFIALDAEGSFSSAAGNRLFERITPIGPKPKDWAPRVRKFSSDGKVTILATVAPGPRFNFTSPRLRIPASASLWQRERDIGIAALGADLAAAAGDDEILTAVHRLGRGRGVTGGRQFRFP